MLRAREKRNIYKILIGKINEIDHYVDGKIILKWRNKDQGINWFKELKVGTNGRILWELSRTFEFHKIITGHY
jgi:hypothetical protein